MRSVIINADDYGLTTAVSRAIVRAHTDGVVTSTSALVVAPAFAATAAWLDDAPTLGVGLHLAAVGEDPPLLSAAEVPTLVDRRGNFAVSSMRMVPRLAAGRVDPADLEREFEAQFEAFTATGRLPTHVDTHHNLHLWPTVGEVVARLAERWSVPSVRVPWSRARSPVGAGVRRFAKTLRTELDRAGRWYPDVYFGIDEGGRLDTATLVALIDGLADSESATPDLSVEIAVHPGEPDDADLVRYPWPGASRDAELAALTSPEVRRRLDAVGLIRTAYGAEPRPSRPNLSLDVPRLLDVPDSDDRGENASAPH